MFKKGSSIKESTEQFDKSYDKESHHMSLLDNEKNIIETKTKTQIWLGQHYILFAIISAICCGMSNFLVEIAFTKGLDFRYYYPMGIGQLVFFFVYHGYFM